MSDPHPHTADPLADADETAIAIIGMAAHLPGAGSVAAFWDNLRAGRSAIRRLDEDALIAAGEAPLRLRQPNYVPAAAPLDGFDTFDAEFFGFSPKDAAILDPQHRQFLEVAWEAFEDAGHPPHALALPVGVFAGCGMTGYFFNNLCTNPALVEDVGLFLLRHTGNDKDFLSTRVSHIFNLRGPSVNVQTACSTSLVAVHQAVQALLNGECDMALAGGVTVELPHGRGYLYKENEILSPDGECHAFDHRAQGTVFGSGAGAVVLRRLADAQAAGDRIIAVIRGSAINNDGAAKAGYLAPSVEGQADAVAAAHAVAGVSPDSIGYVECHGTGTYLGDPIEVAALTDAFRRGTDGRGFCRIGSVKTNIGHLDTAAGVASLIKAAKAVETGELPPSLGFEAPNPAIDFDASPFVVNDRLTRWDGPAPRRAGVNSLGVGGTNAHVVLEEPPAAAPSDAPEWPFQILPLSARSGAALDAAGAQLAAHLRAAPDTPLADVAWTLKEGRTAFERRRVLVADSAEDAAQLLEAADPRRVHTHTALERPDVVFMFPGGGAQYAGMARDLYDTEPVFAEWMDRGLEVLDGLSAHDIRALWLPAPGAEPAADAALRRPSLQLPLIMITEYALAQMFMGWGVRPAALIGHSMGENTAAALAGVMSFQDCIALVHLRGTLFDTVPAGGMLSVPLSVDALAPFMAHDLDIASVNAPELTVVSGPDAALDALAARLGTEGIDTQRIAIDIAAHSRMLEPILTRFGDFLRGIDLHPPQLPVISNRTGAALGAAEATDPDYWVGHLRHTVRFADGIATLAEVPSRVYLEMGPGRALASLVRMGGAVPGQQVLSVLRHPEDPIADDRHHLEVLARLWALGADFDWSQIWGAARRAKLSLPTYPFQRSRYFIEPGTPANAAPDSALTRLPELADWGFTPRWVPAAPACELDVTRELAAAPRESWLIFADDAGVADPVIARLRAAGHAVVTVRAGDAFVRRGADDYLLAPERGRDGYDALIQTLIAEGRAPGRIAHFWLVTQAERFRPGSSFVHRNLEQGFHALLFLGEALMAESVPVPLHLTVVTSGAAARGDEPLPHPEKAAIAGPARVLPREAPGITCTTLDIVPGGATLTDRLLEELLATPGNRTALLRGERRFEAALRPAPLPDPLPDMPRGAHWIITGGLGGIGLRLAEELLRRHGARVTLIARRPLPDRARDAADTRRLAALERLRALGEVELASADVCNVAQMRAALDQARARFGAPHGLIHAAGRIDDAPMMGKPLSRIEDVIAPKLHGLRVIDDLLPDGTLDWLVVFSSTSVHTAPAGQVDYVAANAFLDAFARSRAGGRTRVRAIGWGLWSEIGMGAEALRARLGTPPEPVPLPGTVPLWATTGTDAQGNRVLEARIDAAHWLVDEHRTARGTALLPGTGMLELAALSLAAQGDLPPFELRDLHFFRATEVPDGAARILRATLEPSDEGFELTLSADATAGGRAGHVLIAQARLALGGVPAPDRIDPAAIEARCPQAQHGPALHSPQAAHMRFGPRWQVLERMALGTGEGLAHLALPDAAAGDLAQGHVLHPALMDIATGWAMALIPGYAGRHLWVPLSYGSVRVHRPLPARIVSHVRLRPGSAEGFAEFDVTLATPDGAVCAEVARFAIKRLEAGFEAGPIHPSEMTFDTPAPTTLSPAEARLRAMQGLGITADEGAEAFLRALNSDHPQLVVSSIPPSALIAEAEADADPQGADAQSFERPQLDGDHVPPRNEIERVLAGFWEDLLGVRGIGVEDSFFDLGGHSLIAVRLFARIKKAFAVEFPISVLFQAPTIAACAAMIADATGIDPDADQAPDTASPAAPARPRFTHLVAMHEGTPGAQRPFFLVAGMFGNVLNLRHLAQLLGRDRPFYGLQARGLMGGADPHERIEDAARDIIAEMRAVQPQGPYLLGGFSGGGITAWEIGQQLRAEGDDVALLVLLDTPLPQRPAIGRADKTLIKLAEFRQKGPGYALEWWRARRAWAEHLRAGAAADSADAFHNAAIEAAFRHAVARYRVQRWDGNAVLFRPPLERRWKITGGRWVDRHREIVLPDNDWTRFAPALRVFEVPGDHDSMVLEPNVRVLGGELARLIDEAEAAAPRPAQAAE